MITREEASSDRVYDGYAKTYGFDIRGTLAARLKYELALAHLSPHAEVLDVGCANGIHLRVLAAQCKRIVGVDINAPMLAVARDTLAGEGIRNAELMQRSAADLGFADASFDLVYSFSTLLLVPEVHQALAEISRVLRPGGAALLDITGRYNLSRIYWGWYYRRHGHFGVHSFRYRDIVQRLEALGLDVIERHALGFLDQWKYLPGLHWCRFLDRWFHGPGERDLDYRLSNLPLLCPLANRWYLVCRKRASVPARSATTT